MAERVILSDPMERRAAQGFADQLNATGHDLGLFANNITPSESTVLADLTEPSGDWYSRIVSLIWADPYTSTGKAIIESDPQEFAYSGADPEENIYGWFLVDPTNDSIWMAKRFDDAPRAIGPTTGPLTFRPGVALFTEPAP